MDFYNAIKGYLVKWLFIFYFTLTFKLPKNYMRPLKMDGGYDGF